MTGLSGRPRDRRVHPAADDPRRRRGVPARERDSQRRPAGRGVGAPGVRAEPAVRAARRRSRHGRRRAARLPRPGGRRGAPAAPAGTTGTPRPTSDDDDPWRIGRGAVIGLALGSAILVHPVIGFFAVATVGIVGAPAPARRRARRRGRGGSPPASSPCPQLATMVGLSLPTIVLGIGLPVAIAVGHRGGPPRRGRATDSAPGWCASPSSSGSSLADRRRRGARPRRSSPRVLDASKLPEALAYTRRSRPRVERPAARRARRRRRPREPRRALTARLGGPRRRGGGGRPDAGAPRRPRVPRQRAAVRGPEDRPLLAVDDRRGGRRVRPRVHSGRRPATALPWLGRVAAVAAFVVVAALPLRVSLIPLEPGRSTPTTSASTAGRRRSRSTCTSPTAASGVGFPDARTVVDEPRQEILDAVRAEIDAGRLRHDTPVLHVAQQLPAVGRDAARRLRRGLRDVR